MSTERILVVDDHADARYALERLLLHRGFSVLSAATGEEALEKAKASPPDLILLDIMMPLLDGLQVIRRLKSDEVLRFVSVVLVTAKDSLADVVKGLDAGADDYIVKPFHNEELVARVRAVLRLRKALSELHAVRAAHERVVDELSSAYSFESIVGSSAAMTKVFRLVEKVRQANSPVLITGESGTGKELIARAIHFNSPRRTEPFVARNCAAFNDNLLESELFGHAKGSFTGAIRDQKGIFELSDGGTLFLDEVGEMTASFQAKLLRVIQEGIIVGVGMSAEKRVNVRIIAATNRDLAKMVSERNFREDLYYRLNVVSIPLPPLRERREDIPALISHFLQLRHSLKRLSTEAESALVAYNWPGNVRELQNEVERMLVLAGDDAELGADLISDRITIPCTASGEKALPAQSLRAAIEEVERRLIGESLKTFQGNRSKAAKHLGMSRSNLISKIEAYGLGAPEDIAS